MMSYYYNNLYTVVSQRWSPFFISTVELPQAFNYTCFSGANLGLQLTIPCIINESIGYFYNSFTKYQTVVKHAAPDQQSKKQIFHIQWYNDEDNKKAANLDPQLLLD